jgi:large subunit ribosomal protein L24
MHVKKGDEVVILTGKDKGKTGKIVKSLPKENKVIVEGLNQVKKHMKPRKRDEKGQTITVSLPMNASNVARKGEATASKPKAKKPAVKKVAVTKAPAKEKKS